MRWLLLCAASVALCACGGTSPSGGSGGSTGTFTGQYTGSNDVLIAGVVTSSGSVTGTVFANRHFHFDFTGTVHGTVDGDLINGTWPSDGANVAVTYQIGAGAAQNATTGAIIVYSLGTYSLYGMGWIVNPGDHQASMSFTMNKP